MNRLAALFLLVFITPTFAQLNPDAAAPKYQIPDVKYPTAEAFVITYNIMDYAGADNTGKTDQAPLIKKLLKKMEASTAEQAGVGNGGILFLPEGKYLLNSNIIVPKGVTIRGEWQKPEKGKPIVGTILMSDFGRGEETKEKSLFILQPAAAVKDLAIWYPRQNADSIVPYPPSIGFGQPGYFGNEYCVAKNITFVNSYSGGVLLVGGGAPNMFGLYGTPLKRGLEIDFIAEVGRVEVADFSPEYWIGSGLPGAPRNAAKFKTWLKDNGTAVVMRRNDWSYVSDVRAEGYCIGFYLGHTMHEKEDSKPNGHNYLLRFTDCRTALYAEKTSVGVMFHDVEVNNCDYGIFVPDSGEGDVQASRWTINADYAVAIDQGAAMNVVLNQSEIASGKIETLGGNLVMLDTDIKTQKPQMKIGAEGRVLVTGCRFSQEIGIINRSLYQCKFLGKPLENYKKIPEFPYKPAESITQRPERTELYVATEHGIKPNDNNVDNTKPLQTLLDKAAADGGGIVYLPPGKYRLLGHISVPTGVELHGSVDVGSVPLGPGSVLEAYEGKGNAKASPFITMQERSGLRGIVINYPEQKFNDLLKGTGENAIIEPLVYPYAVRVAGKGVWLVNVGLRATHSGIDLFTNKCDDFYMQYLSGHIFVNGIRIGGKTENARICNSQFNTIGYACGDESKFGRWANARKPGADNKPAYRQNYRDLTFIMLEDCRNTWLFNNFLYESRIGVQFGSDVAAPTGLALGLSVDGANRSLVFRNLNSQGFDLICSQIVTVREGSMLLDERCYVETDERFRGTANMFSAHFWGSPNYAIVTKGGTLNIQAGRCRAVGERFHEASRGTLRLFGNVVNTPNNKPIVNEKGEQYLEAMYSLINSGTSNKTLLKGFDTNLPDSPQLTFQNVLDRKGWSAVTSNGSGNAMFDGNMETRWGTGKGMKKGDWMAINMGKVQTFDTLLLDQDKSGGDYPKRFDVFVSDNGRDWRTPIASGEGSEGITIVRFPKEQKKRYVRLMISEPREQAGLWWSVSELYAMSTKSDELVTPVFPKVLQRRR